MDFRFGDDQLAFAHAVDAFCRDRCGLEDVAGRESKPADQDLWSGLAELGVLGMFAGDGEELLPVEAAIAFEVIGAHLVTGPVIWSTISASLVAGVEEGAIRVTGVEADDATGGPVLVDHVDESDLLLVLRGDGVERIPTDQLGEVTSGAPLDPLTPVGVLAALPVGECVGDRKVADRLRTSGTLLAAASLVGVAQGALDVARAYALEREQFGRPIGSFQAIKHLLADMYVRSEMARSATYAAAALMADGDQKDRVRALASAKVLAGEAGIGNGRAAVQILGGMGFTWDMHPHYFLKRAWTLEHAFGSAPSHALALAAALGSAGSA